MRKLAAVATTLFAFSLAPAAFAFHAGATNYSGKTAGSTCGNAGCHTGGAIPTVKIDGPTTLAAGAQGQYTFTVTTTLTTTGADIAGSDGVTFTAGTGLQSESGELTQTGPLAATGGAAQYTFTVTAPTAGSSMTLYACGVGADGNGTSTGDGAATTTLAVTITGGSAAPPASASSSSSSSSSSSGAATTTSTGDDDDDSRKNDPRNPFQADSQSCAVTPGLNASGVVAALFVAVGLIASTRRRTPRR